MIEVEIKIDLSNNAEEKLLRGAERISQKVIEDQYYDTSDYQLTTHDFWLRQRDGRFELKLPLVGSKGNYTDRATQYEEIEDDDGIKAKLGFPLEVSLEDELKKRGYSVFCHVLSTRRKYKNREFSIDLDTTDFGFALGEVELLVEAPSGVKAAEKKILEFLEECGVTTEVRKTGKIIEYIKRFNPEQYAALTEAGMIRG